VGKHIGGGNEKDKEGTVRGQRARPLIDRRGGGSRRNNPQKKPNKRKQKGEIIPCARGKPVKKADWPTLRMEKKGAKKTIEAKNGI